MFDLDPKQKLGVNESDLEFAHLLLMYLSSLPDFDYTEKLQRQAVKNHQSAALSNLIGVEIDGTPIIKKAESVIDSMKWFFADDEQALELLEYERCKLYHRPCMQIRAKDIYQSIREGDNDVRAPRVFRERARRFAQTASGFLFTL